MLREISAVITAGIIAVSFPIMTSAGSQDDGHVSAMKETLIQNAVDEEYIIGAGDLLDISVWKDDALTRSSVVRPDGVFSLF